MADTAPPHSPPQHTQHVQYAAEPAQHVQHAHSTQHTYNSYNQPCAAPLPPPQIVHSPPSPPPGSTPTGTTTPSTKETPASGPPSDHPRRPPTLDDDMRDDNRGLIDPRYCCCAVPLVNAGIYAVLAEQTAVAFAVGILSFVAPSVVGAASPVFVTYILGIVCFVGVALQPVGFIGVFREKTKTFRIYSALSGIVTLVAMVVAAAIIIISAVKHDTAMARCKADYFQPDATANEQAETMLDYQSDPLCMAFAWADIGIMAGLWVICLIMQGYFVFLTRRYGRSQVKDHKLYHSVYSENPEAFTMSILQSRRYNPDSVMWTNSMVANNPPPGHADNAWDHRPSYESMRSPPAGHEPGPDAGGGYYGGRGNGQFDDYDQQNSYAFNQPGPGYVDHQIAPQR